MFTASKLLPLLLLPPGLLWLLAAGALLLVRKRRRRAASWLLGALLVLLYLLSTPVMGDALLLPLEDRYPPLAPGPAGCRGVVVLGGAILPVDPGNEGAPGPAADSLARSLAAYRIWKRLGVPLLVTGYGEWPGLPSAAETMAARLREWGVPGTAITLESESRNTFENARNSAPLLREKGWGRVCLVTSAYHMPRAVLAFAYFQVPVVPCPAHYVAHRLPATWRSFLPTMAGLSRSHLALREYLGLLYYGWFYGV